LKKKRQGNPESRRFLKKTGYEKSEPSEEKLGFLFPALSYRRTIQESETIIYYATQPHAAAGTSSKSADLRPLIYRQEVT